jgi:hypothetical protein
MSRIFVSSNTQPVVDMFALTVGLILGMVMATAMLLFSVCIKSFPEHWTSGTTSILACVLMAVIFPLSSGAVTLTVALLWKYIVGTSSCFLFLL